MTKLDEFLAGVWNDVTRQTRNKARNTFDISVYVSVKYYRDLVGSAGYTGAFDEHRQKVFGYPIFIVNHSEHNHPNFVVRVDER